MKFKRMKFNNFNKELQQHNAKGYHRVESYLDDLNHLSSQFSLNSAYLEFINTVGYGRFFDGSLVLFPLEGEYGSIKSETNKLQELGFKNYVAIGYDGTTVGYYCLKNNPVDDAVYWADMQTKTIEKIAGSFFVWIEGLPKELFNKKTYAAYKEIKDINNIQEVIRQRSMVEVELLDYDKKLVKPPGRENDLLPRYHKLILTIYKKKEITLTEITVGFYRVGSSVGKNNISHVTLDIHKVPVKKSTPLEAYLFDPFNVPFDKIVCIYDPDISLSSKSRIRYKEILDYL